MKTRPKKEREKHQIKQNNAKEFNNQDVNPTDSVLRSQKQRQANQIKLVATIFTRFFKSNFLKCSRLLI